MTVTEFGKYITEKREALGVSAGEFSRLIGADWIDYQRIEGGYIDFRVHTLKRVCIYLNLEVYIVMRAEDGIRLSVTELVATNENTPAVWKGGNNG